MPLITHRGADGLAHANTIEAIEIGDSFSPRAIEIDVNCTSDGVLVAIHGPIRQEQNGEILEVTYAELLDMHHDIPLFKDTLDLPTKSPYLLDIKTKNIKALGAMKLMIDSSSKQIYSYTSPHVDALLFFKNAYPEAQIFITQPYHHNATSTIQKAHKYKLDGVMFNKWWLGPQIHLLCKRYKLQMNVYTVDSRRHMMAIQKLLPEVNIVTNRPDKYRQAFPITE